MSRSIENPVHLLLPRSAYIHVPFCVHRCGYCDFTLVAGKDHLIDDYLTTLELELNDRRAWGEFADQKQRIPLDTLYFGGGTPTHLSPDELQRLFKIVFKYFDLADDAEFTVEANPVDLTDDKIAVLTEVGVNRISLGVQAFEKSALDILERDHTHETIIDGMNRLQRRIDNVSLDLIFAIPGQSLDQWRSTLSEAVALAPTHLSTYCLTFEKGTSFHTRLQQGNLREADDDLQRDMYAEVMDFLPAHGYSQYEISSFAKPGCRSQHNQVYWSGRGYFGFGPGAARYLNGVRETNHRGVSSWLKNVSAGESGTADREQLSDKDRAHERLILGLRQIDGINIEQFSQETGYTLSELTGTATNKLIAAGHLERQDTTLRLTKEGRFFADSVTLELM
ncbi:MAG: radical SAM family heme chaperone HemW [Planctomycetaceae bacterium]|nr:radical SAM family heme chaperone HemW [Planctomycetaceae bacterium]MDG2388261.1 radical SAM family heme chaperone HemW [Planctomycetaceae bacterium]